MSAHTVWEKEFEELFKKNYSKLFYYALDWVEDSEVAKDIVSELFGDTWRRYERLRNEWIEAYLYRSVHNLCINYLRDKQVEMKYQQEVIEKRENVIGGDVDTHEEQLQVIDEVMDSLGPQTRMIFEQCHFEGRKYQEVAEMLNISVSAVHKHMNKAFTMFRKAFELKNKNKG